MEIDYKKFPILLKGVEDTLDFGHKNKGFKFIDIYKYSFDYLKYLILKSGVCFEDLNEFLKHGPPITLKVEDLNPSKLEYVINYIKRNSEPSRKGDIQITLEHISYLKSRRIISDSNFQEMRYNFTEELRSANDAKLQELKNYGEKAIWNR